MLAEPSCAADTACRDQGEVIHKRCPGIYGGRAFIVIDNTLDRQFDVVASDTASVRDTTYIRCIEAFVYPAHTTNVLHLRGLR